MATASVKGRLAFRSSSATGSIILMDSTSLALQGP
jgi:hypothetical protein